MIRSCLTQPLDRSRARTWALVCAVAVAGVLIGFAVRSTSGIGQAPVGHRAPMGDLEGARSSRPGIRVLLVGNSFTGNNDMGDMVERLAAGNRAAADRIISATYAPDGGSLLERIHDPTLGRLLDEVPWDYVVLQERSWFPAVDDRLQAESVPGARRLAALVRRHGAVPLLLETWGYRDGDVPNLGGADSYRGMQARLHDGYAEMAAASGAHVVPAGDVWLRAVNAEPSLALWDRDGQHPSITGSYLTAATLRAAIVSLRPSRAPDGPAPSEYAAYLRPRLATWMQRVAIDVVGGRPDSADPPAPT